MPLAVSFTAACVRGLGLGNGEAPRVPTSVSVTAGVITITATYTITVSTFPLARVEYRITRGGDAGQYTGSLPGANGSNSSGTISTRATAAGATENLVHATTYTIFFRAIDASGQISPETAGTVFTTGGEVAPTAAAPTLASTSVSGGVSPFIDITWAAGTAGTYSIATRQYSVVAGTGAAGTFTTVTGSTGTARVTTTAAGAPILPNTSYTVYMKYIASSPGTTSTTASATLTTAAEVTANATTAQASSTGLTYEQHRTQFVISRGDVPNNTTYAQNYQFAYGTSVNPTNWAYFGNYGYDSSVTIAGQTPNTTFYVRTRALSTVTNAPGTASSNASVQLNPLIPNAPTLSFSSTSASERGNAYLSWNATTYSTQYHVYRNTSFYASTSGTSMTVTGHSAGTAYNYRVYAGNRRDEFSYSNMKYMTTGNTGVPWSMSTGATSPVRYFGTTVSCEAYIGSLKINIGSVPTNSGDAGYKYIQTIGYEVSQIPGSTLTYTSVLNRRLYFLISGVLQSPPAGWEPWPSQPYLIRREVPQHGLDTNYNLDYYENGVNLGGANISNTAISVTPDGVNWADYVSCVENVVDNINTSIRGRNLYITGYQTTATTYG